MMAENSTDGNGQAGIAVCGGRLTGISTETLAELVTDAVFSFAEDGRVLSGNRAFRELFCQEKREMSGEASFCETVDCRYAERGAGYGKNDACQYCGWRLAADGAKRGETFEMECRIATRSGLAHDLQMRAACESGRLFCRVKDLYESKRLRVLERSVFHDVMNLAVGIKGLVDFADFNDAAQTAEYLEMIRNCSARCVDALLWLRNLRGAEQGSLTPCVSATSVDDLLEEVVGRYREEAATRRVEIAIDGALGLTLETDPELARLVLCALVVNAVEACKRGESVRVSVAVGAGEAVFRVSSPAPLSDNVRAQLFQRSFSTKGTGRGIGTYGAKLIAERYLKGRVWCEADLDKGVCFGFSIPLSRLSGD